VARVSIFLSLPRQQKMPELDGTPVLFLIAGYCIGVLLLHCCCPQQENSKPTAGQQQASSKKTIRRNEKYGNGITRWMKKN